MRYRQSTSDAAQITKELIFTGPFFFLLLTLFPFIRLHLTDAFLSESGAWTWWRSCRSDHQKSVTMQMVQIITMDMNGTASLSFWASFYLPKHNWVFCSKHLEGGMHGSWRDKCQAFVKFKPRLVQSSLKMTSVSTELFGRLKLKGIRVRSFELDFPTALSCRGVHGTKPWFSLGCQEFKLSELYATGCHCLVNWLSTFNS